MWLFAPPATRTTRHTMKVKVMRWGDALSRVRRASHPSRSDTLTRYRPWHIRDAAETPSPCEGDTMFACISHSLAKKEMMSTPA